MIHVIEWDWKEQVDLPELSRIVNELSKYGRVVIQEVNTQSDCYAITISNSELTEEEINEAWQSMWEDEEYNGNDPSQF